MSLFVGEVHNSKAIKLYKASTNGFGGSNFHTFCDNKGPTLSIIKTTGNYIFGGFTNISWDLSNQYKHDTSSFLFSVNKQTKYPIGVNNYQNAIYCGSSYGPTFGYNHTMYASNNSNSNNTSYVSAGDSYNIPAAANGLSILTDGNYNFSTSEIEVYLI